MPDPTFRTKDEWRRAREAVDRVATECYGPAGTSDDAVLVAFDRLYPRPPEHAHADADAVLDAYVDAVRWLRGWALNRDSTRPSEEQIATTRAAVLARMQPVGEVYEVGSYLVDGMYLPMVLFPDGYKQGDRVRVVRVAP